MRLDNQAMEALKAQLGWTWAKLARKCDTDYPAVWRARTGRSEPSLALIVALAKLAGQPVPFCKVEEGV